MDIKDILKTVDHTLLKVDATWDDIKVIIEDGMKYECASVCIPASFVSRAKEYTKELEKASAGKQKAVKICTVIGFPNGYSTTATKCFEAKDAVDNGADEVDMVINIGDLKDKQYEKVLNEIKAVKASCGDKVLKVIIETCLLSDEEKIKMCEIVMNSGADFIKTSTGFSTSGATFDDVKIFAEHISAPVKIKAAGGISSIEDAEEFLSLGADRLGTSRIVKIVKNS